MFILILGMKKMGKFIDLSGQIFGKWTVLEKTNNRDASGGVLWKCQCECGTIKEVSGNSLRRGKNTGCGCVRIGGQKNIAGKKFDLLTALEPTEKRTSAGGVIWKCRCDCGNICFRSVASLNRKNEKHSCGCYNINLLNKSRMKDLTNQKFGLLTAIQLTDLRSSRGGILWECLCECGNTCYVEASNLISKNTQSCGCLKISIGEFNIEMVLKQHNIKYIKEYSNQELNKKRFDFAILDSQNQIKRLIEFDGEQHFFTRKGLWNSIETLEDIQQRDKEKNQWARSHNIPLVRIPYTERDNITLDIIVGDKYLI